MKKKIVHVIDDLRRGGAETMLMALLPDLALQYEITLVTLRPEMEFDQPLPDGVKHVSLRYYRLVDMPRTVQALKKIIKDEAPALVRAQLFWTTIITRLACPKHIPLIFSVHATVNEDPIAFHKRLFLNNLERLTYHPRQTMIGVTQAVVESFIKFHPKHGKTFLLHNFVRSDFFSVPYQAAYSPGVTLQLVSVGNLRLIKNIPYMVEAMRLLKTQPVTLDIYGDGALRNEVQRLIDKYGLAKTVQLKGRIPAVHKVLPCYDAYVSTSTVEGFGIAVAEAMCIGLPVLVSDIPVYREVCGANALYLDNKDPQSLQQIVLDIVQGKTDLLSISKKNKKEATRFSKSQYLTKLGNIYESIQS